MCKVGIRAWFLLLGLAAAGCKYVAGIELEDLPVRDAHTEADAYPEEDEIDMTGDDVDTDVAEGEPDCAYLDDGEVCGSDPRSICMAGACVPSVCGDGHVDAGRDPPEDCDDGNDEDGDGCDNDCTYSCTEHADCDDGHACTDDTCDPADHACGDPIILEAGFLCRPADGACDAEEYCDGENPDCPADSLKAAGEICRSAAGQCDDEESCTGHSQDCPVDGFLPDGTACDDGIFCTIGDCCDGSGRCAGVPTDDLHDVVEVAAGDCHTCVRIETGEVKCWGCNVFGQVGDGTAIQRTAPEDVTGLASAAVDIAAGFYHTCAVLDTGGVQCWGRNDRGQLGDGTDDISRVPVNVTGLVAAVAVGAGEAYTCAVISGGDVTCWGANGSGQLGDGTDGDSLTPVDTAPGITMNAEAISCGSGHSCALLSSRDIQCWGANGNGQLGNGTYDGSLSPLDVDMTGWSAVSVSAGSHHTCAVRNEGTSGAKCWGRNNWGQLGDGSTTPQNTPVDVQSLVVEPGVTAAGEGHSCGLLISGALKCWGWNIHGQLGDGTTANSSTPVDVSDLAPDTESEAVAIAAGHTHTCAVLDTGAVRCWGANDNGQLGSGTDTDELSPVTVICE